MRSTGRSRFAGPPVNAGVRQLKNVRAIFLTYALTIEALKERRHGLYQALFYPGLALVFLSPISEAASFPFNILAFMASMPPYIVLAVRVHEQILLVDPINERARGNAKYWLYAFAALIVGLISVCPMLILAGTSFVAAGGAKFPEPAFFVLSLIFATGVASSLYLSSRASLILPERALGRPASLSEAWDWSSHNGWKLAGALLAPPMALGILVQLLVSPLPERIQDSVSALFGIPITILGVALLSVAYRQLRARNGVA